MTHRNPPAPQRLLEAARAEFARQGLAGARTARIARRAGVNKQLIHYHFGGKDQLHRAVLADAAAELVRALSGEPDGRLGVVERLRRMVRDQFDFMAQHHELTQLLLRAEISPEWVDPAVGPLVTLLTEGQATGFFRDDVDPPLLARQILVLQLGYLALRPVAAAWPAAQWRDATTELVIRGCTW
jgi:TetR/AcrR family transcriptional regulator